jgi:spermidine synthase
MPWYFLFFLISGFCSVLYEVIWLRLAMAQYGVTTPLVSLVLSIFMLGLGIGSWGAGRLVKRWRSQLSFPALRLYAITEFFIGLSALVVPYELVVGRQLLEKMESHGLSGSGFYIVAGAWIALSLVPWCTCMGATFPFAMFAIEETHHSESPRSFSYLYLANVLGAILAGVPLLVIEVAGFHKTLQIASGFNFFLAVAAFALTLKPARSASTLPDRNIPATPPVPTPGGRKLLWLLFGTGLTSMAAEVIWVRMFTAWLSSVVYAFATILAFYLGATYLGSILYRKRLLNRLLPGNWIWAALAFTVLLPLVAGDPRLHAEKFLRLAIGVIPFSAMLGFVTPLMVDRFSVGDGERAGRAYAANILGCIFGPLLAGFVLLPLLGERASLTVLALPWFALGLFLTHSAVSPAPEPTNIVRKWAAPALALVSIVMFFSTTPFEDQFAQHWVRRDYVATVVAKGSARLDKRLLVNGVGMTGLRPITKVMAHFPLALLDRKPENILIICFGMGTTHRAALSWGISSTVVELVPSVPQVYGFFHADGPALLQSPRSHLVIDDGRRFLERTSGLYDVITIDPPPPVEAAGSSLLYSREFYSLAKRHLRPGGILQQWLPTAEPIVQASVAKALQESFPNVKVFSSIMGNGLHFLASMSPLPSVSAQDLASHMPEAAAADFVEWGPESTPERQFADLLANQIPPEQVIAQYPNVPALEDDRPVNEYYYLRHHPTLGKLLALGGWSVVQPPSDSAHALAPAPKP